MMVVTSSAGLAKLNVNNKNNKNKSLKKIKGKYGSLGSKKYVSSNLMIIRKIKFSDPVESANDDRFGEFFKNINSSPLRSAVKKNTSLTYNNFSRSIERHGIGKAQNFHQGANINNSVERNADILERSLYVQKLKCATIQKIQQNPNNQHLNIKQVESIDLMDRIGMERIQQLPSISERPKLPSLNFGVKQIRVIQRENLNFKNSNKVTENNSRDSSPKVINPQKANLKTEQSIERGRIGISNNFQADNSTLNDLNSIFLRESSPNKKFSFKMGGSSVANTNTSINSVNPGKNLPSIQNKNYFFIIKRGNNKELIKTILLRRSNWKEASSDLSTFFNFKWSNSRKKTEYSLFKGGVNNKRITNHFEFDHEISNKKFMFLNFLEFCDKNKLNVFNYVPFTAVVKINGMNYKENFKNFSIIFSKMKDLTIQHNEKINSILEKLNTNNLNILPPTPYFSYQDLFKSDIINYKTGDCQVFFPNTHFTGKNLWIIKPTDLWGGKCIQISDNILEIERIIKRFHEGMDISIKKEEESMSESGSEDEDGSGLTTNPVNPISKLPEKSEKTEKSEKIEKSEKTEKTRISNRYRASTVLLQKYIESPLLYYGRKFDIRMWALIDCKMDLYLFREGHLKTTSTEYTTESKDKFVHITNYSLQKHNNNFEKFEVGNEVSFKDFQNCLDTVYKDSKINIKNDIIPQMVDIIKLTALSVKDKLNKKDRQFCYLLLGYDFMIDTNFKVWLIEINKNPGLVESSPVINSLVPRLLDDCFRLTIDDVFDTKYNHETRYPVEGYSDEENMFEFLLTLK